jgi:purine-cytosine permease-like protein
MKFSRISPTLVEDRVDKRLYQMFFVWFSANLNITALSTGTAGPAFFNLGLRDTLVILLVVDIMYVQSTKISARLLMPFCV